MLMTMVDNGRSLGIFNWFLVCLGLDSSSNVSTHTSSTIPYNIRVGCEQKRWVGALHDNLSRIMKKEQDIA